MKYLRSGQLNGYRFLRQKPIDELLELIMGCIEKIENNTPLNPPLIGGRDPIPLYKGEFMYRQ